MNDIPAELTSVQHIEIDESSEGQRIDNFLLKTLKGVPKSKIYRCMRKGEVRVNGGRIKAQAKLKIGDIVRVPPIRMSENEVHRAPDSFLESLEKSIIYEDKRLIVINKPAGIAVHGGSGINLGVIEGMRQLRSEAKFLELVHRLDRDTSGCLMIAKKRSTLKQLHVFLANKNELGKYYLALVHGRWPKRKQHVDLPIRKNTLASGERICVIAADGKQSLTKINVLQQNADLSLLEVMPVTGRTHQIRVHCKHIGYPIVGDPKYGLEDKDKQMKPARLMLHAQRLEIPVLEPGSKAFVVEAELDKKFLKNIKVFN
ncbi:MAG: 23S rRNA pseudouridine955/2504/2580 synthase [Candidatus Azotimanducaceae bacterium]|jgi:23S rRNA pseudouridine955/2504/2580 synthase